MGRNIEDPHSTERGSPPGGFQWVSEGRTLTEKSAGDARQREALRSGAARGGRKAGFNAVWDFWVFGVFPVPASIARFLA